jgi:D-alanine-D-alanine ligase
MRITLLVYVEREGDKEHDKSIDQIAAALATAGHQASIMHVHDDVPKFVAGLRRRKPDLIFNLMEQFGAGMLGLVEATALLDLLEIPYTGSGAGELFLQEDKALTKKLLAYEKVNCPDYAVFSPHAELETGGNLRMPLFVKPLRMDASFGIDASRSLVATTADLMKQVTSIHQQFNDSALCEQYIEGREFYVGVLGNSQPQAFPPVEIDFSGMPEGAPHVMDSKAKFEEGTPEFEGTKAVIPDISAELRAKLQEVALTSYRALRVRDYGRIDLRLTEAGEIYVIEVNANCYLEKESEYAMSAAAAGIPHDELIAKIADLALERHRIAKGSAQPRKKVSSAKPKPLPRKAAAVE